MEKRNALLYDINWYYNTCYEIFTMYMQVIHLAILLFILYMCMMYVLYVCDLYLLFSFIYLI